MIKLIWWINTALRRRFQFEEMLPDAGLLSNIKFEGINIQELLTVICNQYSQFLLSVTMG